MTCVPIASCATDLPFVMVAHAAYPQITGDNTPASLSKKWMSDVLRKKIGYRGLIITDDLDMGGVLAASSIEDAAVETLARRGRHVSRLPERRERVARLRGCVKQAESDKKFAKLVAEKARRVLAAEEEVERAAARMAAAPTQKTVERLTRKIWEFSEEIVPGRMAW